MTAPHEGRDQAEVDALVTDRYLDSLLAAHARGADTGPTPTWPDPGVARSAERLGRDLPRLHPSFRFEEALAARLAAAAAGMQPARAAGAEGAIVPFGSGGSPWHDLDPSVDDLIDLEPGVGERLAAFGRPIIIGGALTSAAISIAGAAYVAWRLNRPPLEPMVRAVRAVARSRPA